MEIHMPIFNPKTVSSLAATIQKIAHDFYASTPLVLTPDEFIQAFVAPEHLDSLLSVQNLFGVPLTAGNINTSIPQSRGTTLPVVFAFRDAQPITVPPYARSGLQPGCSAEVKEKITQWADERYRLGAMFGDAIGAFYFLNDNCGDLAAMRLVFPAITTIMGRSSEDPNDRVVVMARKLADTTKYGRLPKLSPEQRARLSDVAALVNSACLVKDAAAIPGGVGTAFGYAHNFRRIDKSLFAPGGWMC